MIGTELLDDPRADAVLVGRQLRDIARLNALFGGTRAVVRELEPFLERGKAEPANGKRQPSFDRVARRAVVLADLRRSRLAMAGVWAASLCLAMSGVSRHDAVLSLKRGYTREEFCDMLRDANVRAVARYRPGARIVAAWSPGAGPQ